jgi:hypothetical protein
MNSWKFLLKPALLLCMTALLFVTACKNDDDDDEVSLETAKVKDYDSDVIVTWNKVFLDVERYAAGYRPGPANSALAYMALGAYEASVTAMPGYKSLENVYKSQGLNVPDIQQGSTYHYPSIVNAIYGSMMKEFFKATSADLRFKIATTETQFKVKYLEEEKIPQEVFDRSEAYGKQVATAMMLWANSDPYGYKTYQNPRPKDYTPPKELGNWQPTYPDLGGAMTPYWGKARTFAINEAEKLSLPPMAFSEDKNSAFYKQALEVYNKNTPALDYEEQWIAEYWSDDALNLTFSPGPRWIAIANQVLETKKLPLDEALYTEALVSMALNDASVAGWYSKYYYNLERPVSYIRRNIDPNWEPHLWFTPSFPAYPSGHSIMGAAGGEVLSQIFGENYAMLDRSHEGRKDFLGIPRSFSSFRDMAYENAYSRIPLGVHFRIDFEEGVRHGYAIGKKVMALPFK